MKYHESELAEAFESYSDPESVDFDPQFTRQILDIRPDWFDEGEVEKLVEAGLLTSIGEYRRKLRNYYESN